MVSETEGTVSRPIIFLLPGGLRALILICDVKISIRVQLIGTRDMYICMYTLKNTRCWGNLLTYVFRCSI